MTASNKEIAILGAGCFWCVEAVFQDLKGVESVVSGYIGGAIENPTYKQICTGTTGHAEVCKITFDPTEITFEEILEIFWHTHNPTTLNRQGNDVGTQYRSAIFYLNETQKNQAIASKEKATKAAIWADPIVTEISEAPTFYEAENYHQNYFKDNPSAGYCAYIINPKVQKFRKQFREKLK